MIDLQKEETVQVEPEDVTEEIVPEPEPIHIVEPHEVIQANVQDQVV